MDEFAQTRGADDLFDDDFTPIAEPVVQNIEPQPQHNPHQARNGPAAPRGNRAQDSFSRQSKNIAVQKFAEDEPGSNQDQILEEGIESQIENQESITFSRDTPQLQYKGPTAVRGDRTATGGTPKPKLTEEELSARLAAAKLNNAKRAEAHRLAEADEASFQQREAHASQKRKEEGQAKRIMNMERETNRLRKLGAQAGREWDEGKEEVDRRDERNSQYRRAAHGGVAFERGRRGRGGGFGGPPDGYQDGVLSDDFHDQRGYRGRGRGRGDRGRGRGRGRGGFVLNNHDPQLPPDPVSDFPELPNKSRNVQPSIEKNSNSPFSPITGESWADEVQATKASDGGT